MVAYTHFAATTLTLQKQGGTGTLTLTRRGDGSFVFTDAEAGTNEQVVHSNEPMRLLFEALQALA